MELADGAELTEHQVDVLSGTLAALTAELEDSVAAEAPTAPATPRGSAGGRPRPTGPRPRTAIGARAEEEETLAPDEEPQDWDEPAEEIVDEAPEDPGASAAFGSSMQPARARRSPLWGS